MRVLVSTASKHGSTADIGRAIAETLSGDEIEARIAAPEEVTGLDGYDAVILGSAVIRIPEAFLDTTRRFRRGELGAFATGGPLGSGPVQPSGTASALNAFEANGYLENGPASSPYTETVQRAMRYTIASLTPFMLRSFPGFCYKRGREPLHGPFQCGLRSSEFGLAPILRPPSVPKMLTFSRRQ